MTEPRTSQSPAKPSRPRVGFWRWVWRICAGSFAVLVLLLALFIGLFRVAVPLLPDYQQRIESAATNAIGHPLSVGGVDARWRLRGPELVFDNVEVRTIDNERTLFEADRLRVAIDLVTLIQTGQIQPSSLTLTGAQLDVLRDADGSWYVQGLPLEAFRSDKPSTVPWGVADGLFGVRNLGLNFKDESKGMDVTISDIDLDIAVSDTILSLSGELEFVRRGERIEFSLDADGRADKSDELVWTGYLSGQDIDWSSIAGLLPASNHWATQEPFDLAVWLRARGAQPEEANVTVNVRDFTDGETGNSLTRLGGQFSWIGNEDSWQLTGENVDISSGEEAVAGVIKLGSSASLGKPDSADVEGVALPVAGEETLTGDDEDASSAVEAARAPVVNRYTFAATELNLEELSWLAAPLSARARELIDAHAPHGTIRDLEGFVEISDRLVLDFGASATLNDFGASDGQDRVSVEGVDARIFGGREKGGIELTRATKLSLPGVLRRDVLTDVLEANINWSQLDSVDSIRVNELKLVAQDFAVDGGLSLERQSSQGEWIGDFDLAVDRLNLVNAHNYFPVNKFSGKLLAWLDNALLAGTGTEGVFKLKGPVKKFPFPNPDDGEFFASVKLEDATLHYANNWPDATEITAVIEFERNSLRAQIERAQLLTLPIQNAQATIEDLKASVVFIEGSLSSQLDDMRSFLDATPIVDSWGQSWPDAQFYGNGSAQMSLTIPTKQRENTQFDVALQFNDARFQFRDWRQTATELIGEMRATRDGIRATGIRGRFLGEPVEIGVEPSVSQDYTSDIFLKGTAVPSSLARHVNESLADHLSGATQWTANFSLPKVGSQAPLQVRMRSPLDGMAVTLPEPLQKSAADTRFTDAVLTVADESLLSLSVDYGDDTNIVALVRRSSDGYWTVPRGELRFGGGSAALPDEELVRVMGSISSLDMSQVVEFAQRNSSERPWIDFNQADLVVNELKGLNQNFGQTTVEMVHDQQGFDLNFVGERISGALEVPALITPENPIVGRFEKLYWASTDSEEPIDPSEAPSLRAVVDDFRFNDYALGALVAHLEARENLVAVREFTTTMPDYSTRTTGSWVFSESESTTYLVTELKSSNMKNTLSSLGQAEILDSNDATARFEMTWPNGWTPDYLRTMEGELSVVVGQGKLISVDPGAGRVFGLMSIGALPRRLNLDFRDVFDSGFGFDIITGDFVITQGNAVTENLALSGPAANVVIVGRTGIIEKDYDQTALVYANFGSSLPIAGAIAGGPVVGAALLVVTEIFKKPLQNMGKVSYSITGTWDEPLVVRTGSARPVAVERAPPLPEDSSDTAVEEPTSVEGAQVPVDLPTDQTEQSSGPDGSR